MSEMAAQQVAISQPRVRLTNWNEEIAPVPQAVATIV
jgi:hypothetical protein